MMQYQVPTEVRTIKNKHIRSFYTCSKCGGAITGEKKFFFTCPECGGAVCLERRKRKDETKYCGTCGASLIEAKEEKGNRYGKRFYICSRCRRDICGRKEKFFVCPDCGEPLFRKEELVKSDVEYCGNCGFVITSAKEEALALIGRED